ncbi:MAG: ATP-binding protein [Candidatus Woesearchaeota archaeon]
MDSLHQDRVVNILSQAVNQSPFGLVIASADIPDNPLVYANEGFTRLTGYSFSEVEGRNCRFLQGEDTQQTPLSGLRDAIKNFRPYACTLRNYTKSGELFYNDLMITPASTDQGNFFVGTQRDVTARERLYSSLREESSSLDEQVGDLLHDARNKLGVFTGLCDLAREEPDLLNSLRRYLGDFSSSITQRLEDIRNRKQSYPLSLVDVAAHAQNQVSLFSVSSEHEISYSGPSSLEVFTSRDVYVSALENLLSNASKFIPSSRKGVIDVSLLEEESQVALQVCDNGVGIPEGSLEEIFEEFNFVSSRQEVKVASSGRGLSQVRRELSRVGGVIFASNNKTYGSTFSVKLPKTPAL